VVTALSKRDFLEAYQVREVLEALAVRLAVPRMSDAEVDALEGPIEEMQRCSDRGDDTGFFEANTAFHEAFVVASGNLKLVEVYRRLIGQMGPYRRPSALLRGSLDRSIAEHQAILDAARARRGDRAAELMLDHIRVPQRRLDSLSDEEFGEENLLRSQQAAPPPGATTEAIPSFPTPAPRAAPPARGPLD
jgi:DNA-binding GntR family transcriptional regulator